MLLCMGGFAVGARECACCGPQLRATGCICLLAMPRCAGATAGAAGLAAPVRIPSPPTRPRASQSAVGGWSGTIMVPEGGDVVVASALRSASPLAWYPAGASAVIHCDDFRIDYRSDGSVRQFYSDVSGACAATACSDGWGAAAVCGWLAGSSAGCRGKLVTTLAAVFAPRTSAFLDPSPDPPTSLSLSFHSAGSGWAPAVQPDGQREPAAALWRRDRVPD